MLIGQPSPGNSHSHAQAQTKVWTRPPNKVGHVERWRLWWGSGVTPTAMLEWWEVLLVNTVILITLSLFYFALSSLPPHLSIIARRARYYLSGSEDLL
ncbi:hypothetical protein NBRC10512v2_006713 [Rhodotorula toruloides]